MAAEAPFSRVDLSMPMIADAAISPVHLHHDLVLDPRMDMTFCSVKSEKQSAMDGSHMLTPRMFEADLALPAECALRRNSIKVAAIVTPESPATPPSQPPNHCSPATTPLHLLDAPSTSKKKDRPIPHAASRKKSRSITSTTSSSKRSSTGPSRSSTKPSSGPGEDRRNRCLERNRIAASKCREKKKAWVAALEDTRTLLESRHSALRREHAALVAECAHIKTSLMEHANCHDANIDAWLENEAVKFVKRRTSRTAPANEPKDAPPADSALTASQSTAVHRPSSIGSVLSLSCNDSGPSFTDESAVLLSSPDLETMNYDFMPDEMFPDTS
ncbi:hypothetical protein CDD81_6843 [Ophiocordyceps australis]|uniref:BZIP domain-containing protein n=1 Tax=Ophiocordyceps australis TaxID=1399860 RepID=A0A2C5X990_9HYPO|nr:hypothetical protein CDD81_6843 [Ophiocordyceps australis]